MKTINILIFVIGLFVGGALIIDNVIANYQYSEQISSYWDLSDKASEISVKSKYLDQFVSALQNAGLQGEYDAMWLKTPSNSFDQNFAALQSLQQRMHDLQNMDPSSFQYNTAIEQITGQEQGEAQAMLNVFQDVWNKRHHYEIWNGFIAVSWFLVAVGLVIVSVIAFIANSD